MLAYIVHPSVTPAFSIFLTIVIGHVQETFQENGIEP